MHYNTKIILFIIIGVSILLYIFSKPRATFSQAENIQAPSSELFKDAHEPYLYWYALILASKNNKPEALKIVDAIYSGTKLMIPQQSSIDAFFDSLFIAWVAHNPQLLSSLGLFESIGIREHNAYLNNVSPQILMQNFKGIKERFDQLPNYSYEKLSDSEKISYRIFDWMRQHHAQGEKFLFHEYSVNQLSGILSDLTTLFTQFHILEAPEDVENYLKRLQQIPKQLDQTIELISYQKEKGIVPPAFTLEKVITIIKKTIPPLISDNVFYSHLAQKVTTIDDVDKDSALEQAEHIITQEVYPAFEKLKTYLESVYAQTTANNGVWALPDGDQYYAYMLAYHTTTDLSADEIHEIGLKEVAKIQQHMREILATQGIIDDTKDIGVLMREHCENDPQFFYPETFEGRTQCLIDYQKILDRCRIELHPLFDLKPKAPVNIEPVPEHEQEGMPGAYYIEPSIDGTRPGTFFVNLRSMKENPTYRMETLGIHEAEPGHHFQIALQQEISIPILRKIGHYTAYVEGWALYAEKLAYEQNFYSSAFSKLGHFQDELLRAVRLVVDTGIHKKRWTREQAITYMEKATGFAHDSVVTEVERYFVLPGQAVSYKIGQLKILELRSKAQHILGDRFDIKEFHNVVLKTAASPLSVLSMVIDEYIESKLAA